MAFRTFQKDPLLALTISAIFILIESHQTFGQINDYQFPPNGTNFQLTNISHPDPTTRSIDRYNYDNTFDNQQSFGVNSQTQQQQQLQTSYSGNTSPNELNPQFYDPNRNTQFNTLGSGGGTSFGGTSFSGYSGYGYQSNGLDNIDPNSFCPEFWIAHRNVCYRFIKSPKRNWYDAKKICRAYKSELLNVDNLDKHSFVLKELIVQNNRQNRYFVSARQTSPNSWTNDNNSPLINVEDSFTKDPADYNTDALQENLQENNIYYNRFDDPNDPNSRSSVSGQSIGGPFSRPIDPNDPLNRRDFDVAGGLNPRRPSYYDRTRLVYGFSRSHDRWMFIPSYEFEMNLFICESAQLYNPNNINVLEDDKRKFDYGFMVKDSRLIPRGPYFIREPRDVTFDTAQRVTRNDVTLSCLAGGYPTPEYEWYKEEYVNDNLTYMRIEPLENRRYTLSGGNLIVFNPEQARDQGSYHCVASNKFGRIRSERVQLNFGYIMEFNLKRSPEGGNSNWGKSIYCDPPQHYPSVKYYWSRDFFPNFVDEDQRVFVSNDGALYFSALENIDRANYSCTVQNPASSNGRNGPFFPLRVFPYPNFQTLLFANAFPKVFPEAPIAGEEVRLECVAFGYPVPSYNWTRKNEGLPRNAIQINYNRVLIIPNATLNDNGEYICTTTNNRNTISKSITINVQMRPNFTIPLRDKIKDHNSEVSFICEANAIPDVNYTWYKNAEKLDIERLDRDKYTIQDNVLTIKYLDPEKDDGMYQCGAENQLKGVYSSSQLRVLSLKPSFAKRPLESEIYAIYNGNTTILCDPEAAPRPKFQWKKDGNIIGAGGHRRILPTGTLIISPTSRDDEGLYTCMATNAYGTDESSTRLIVLQEQRFITPLPQRTYSQVYEYVLMHCEVSHDEILDVAYIWKYNGQLISRLPESNRMISDYNTLRIHNTTLLDGGDYECVAKSSVNEISSRTTLIVLGPPGAPGGLEVKEIHKTTARLEWIDGADNGRQILYYNILGRTNWNKTWTNVSYGVHAFDENRYTGRKQAEVSNLTLWSGYEFSVCAVNDLGIGPPSAPSPMYNTHSDKPTMIPENIGGGGGKIGDLRITWDPLKPEHQNGPGIHYKLYWRKYGNETEWTSEVLKAQGNSGSAVVQIGADNYYIQYEVRVQAINDLGSGPISEPAVIYSAENMPQAIPQQVSALGYNSTCLNVSWIPVEETRALIRGKMIGHRLKYWRQDQHEEDSVYYLSRKTRPWALIVGLKPDTYYFVKAMVFNSAGEGPESERYLERTYKNAPQKPPSAVNVFGINPSTVRVVWRYVGITAEEEPIEGYKVRVWEADQDMTTANDTYLPIGNKLEAYIYNLTPGKAYNLRVLAYSNGGDGRMSSPTHHFQMGNVLARNSSGVNVLHNYLIFGVLIINLFISIRNYFKN